MDWFIRIQIDKEQSIKGTFLHYRKFVTKQKNNESGFL